MKTTWHVEQVGHHWEIWDQDGNPIYIASSSPTTFCEESSAQSACDDLNEMEKRAEKGERNA